ncbi:MAG TPA: hypothetical protein ENJ86_14060 [Methylothermaceae bacterium]|nr:hypothetical protein [Methylothermaceae bacterium]
MRFYTQTHQHVCGVDLHIKTLYLCILNPAGEIVLHSNLPAKPKPFLKAIKPFRGDLVVGAECMFSWYWLADLCPGKDQVHSGPCLVYEGDSWRHPCRSPFGQLAVQI